MAKNPISKIKLPNDTKTYNVKDDTFVAGAGISIDDNSDGTRSISTDYGNVVTGPTTSTVGHIATFNNTYGNSLVDSGYTIAKSVPSNALFTDTNYYQTPDYSSGLKISTGTGVNALYVPTGTTSSTVALGNHSHGAITSTGTITSTYAVTTASGLIVYNSSNQIRRITTANAKTLLGIPSSFPSKLYEYRNIQVVNTYNYKLYASFKANVSSLSSKNITFFVPTYGFPYASCSDTSIKISDVKYLVGTGDGAMKYTPLVWDSTEITNDEGEFEYWQIQVRIVNANNASQITAQSIFDDDNQSAQNNYRCSKLVTATGTAID